jgi:pyruvate formate lyase activating enzyme
VQYVLIIVIWKQASSVPAAGRQNVNGVIKPINYGMLTSLALDPIEKKPLQRFYPGSMILSIGSFGCNLHCPFCQNFEISMADSTTYRLKYFAPEDLVKKAIALKGPRQYWSGFYL